MPNLSPEQLAEGRRLMEESQREQHQDDMQIARERLDDWLWHNREALLAPQLTAAEFAQAAADIEAALTPYFQALTRFVDAPSANADEAFVSACERLEAARSKLRDLAAQHNIDLGEQT